MIAHPHLVEKYFQCDDSTLFQPLQLACTVKDLEAAAYMYGKLTGTVRYWFLGKNISLYTLV